MTRISFYILRDAQLAPWLFACRLCDKIQRQGLSVYLRSDEPGRLDEQLWSFDPDSFVPHECFDGHNADAAPVLIGSGEPPKTPRQVLINLGTDVPDYFSSFDRCVEIAGGDEARKAAARQRYSFYRDRGYTLETHEIGEVAAYSGTSPTRA